MSHDEVKRAVGLFYGFVLAIASAPCYFLYLNNEYMIYKKKKRKKKKKKKDPSISLTSPLTRRPPLFTPRVPTSGVLRYTNVKRRSSGYESTPPPFFLPPDIRFKDRRRTNGAPEHSETSVAQGKVSKLPLLVLVTQVNSSLPIRRPVAQPPTPDVQSGIRRMKSDMCGRSSSRG